MLFPIRKFWATKSGMGAMLSQIVCNQKKPCKKTAKACGPCKIRMLSRWSTLAER